VGRIKGVFKTFLGGRTSAGAVSQTVVSNLMIQGTNILCGLVTARALGPKGRGELAAILLWPQFLAYLLTLGIPISSVYNIRRNPALSSAFTALALLSSLVMGFVAAAVGVIIIPHSLHTYTPQVIHNARWVVLTAPLALVGLMLSTLVQSAESFRRYNLFRFTPPFLILSTLLLASKFGHLKPLTAALAYLFAGFPIMIWNFVWIWKRFKPRIAGGLEPARALFGYGVRAWGADLLGTVANQVDRLLVVGMLSPSSMGLYVVAQSAAGLLNVLPGSMMTVLLPKASDRSTEEIVKLTGRAARITIVVMAAAGLPLFLLSGLALRLVYGQNFAVASVVLKLLLAEAVLDGTTAVLTQAFLAAGCPGTVTILQLCGLLTAIPLLAWLAPIWGLNGVGLAMLISTSLRLSFVLLNYRLRLKVRPPSLLLRKEDVAFLYKSRLLRATKA
jgi:antigen flippase